MADLAEWAYKNPASDGDTLDLEEPVEDELRVPLENSLFLRLSPALWRAHVRRKAKESSWAELLALAKTKAQDRRKPTLLRSALRNKYVASLKSKLQVMSKQETLRGIVLVIKEDTRSLDYSSYGPPVTPYFTRASSTKCPNKGGIQPSLKPLTP